MKKSIIFLIIFILTLLPVFSVSVSAEYYNMKLEDIRSEAYLLVNVDTGTIIFSRNADKPLKCASLVKTATAIVVVENCDDLDAVVTVTETALKPLKGLYSTSCDLQVGEQMTVRNLLYCMMLKNANDAANVLAEYIGGTIDDFVKMMNDTAKELGCTNTNFTNPHGLDEEGEYTTANDMYLIHKKAIEYSVITDMAMVDKYTVPATNMSEERTFSTAFDMVEKGTRYYYQYAKGLKCGMTDEAKRCAAVHAVKDAYSYIAIILGCPNECTDGCGYNDNTALYEAEDMLRWTFSNIRMTTVAESTDIMTDIPVTVSADADHVRLVPEKEIQALLLRSVDESSLEYIYDVPESVMAPVEKGQVLGSVKIKYADSVIAEVNLVAGESVSRSGIMYIGYLAKKIFLSPVFLIILAVIIVGILLYMAVIFNNYKKKQKETRKRLREIKEQNYAEFADLSELTKK